MKQVRLHLITGKTVKVDEFRENEHNHVEVGMSENGVWVTERNDDHYIATFYPYTNIAKMVKERHDD